MDSPAYFCVGVVALTSAWVYLLRDRDFTTLALAMFFPGIAALAMEFASGDVVELLRVAAFGTPGPSVNLFAACGFAFLIPIAFVLTCAAVSLCTGWAAPKALAKSNGARVLARPLVPSPLYVLYYVYLLNRNGSWFPCALTQLGADSRVLASCW